MLASLVAALAAVPATYSLAATDARRRRRSAATSRRCRARQLYRQFCGQCHALAQALAAGFGSNNGLGQLRRPELQQPPRPLRPRIVAVTEQFGGHELVVKRMTWQQLDTVAAFLAAATKNNPYLARVTDG